ncbi:hypothetical protein Tco_0195870 [Tanacetum coccineum]
MTTPITTTTANSQMHNDIMAAGSRDHPPMLVMRRYARWQSRFMRYVDTKPNSQPAIDDSPTVPERTILETFANISTENRAHYDAEYEAIHLILTGIGDDMYSTVDACKIARDIWVAIERLQQGESLNKQDVKTNLFWKFGKFTSRDGESIESYYSRFYKMINEMVRNQLEVATMQVNIQFLQQLPPEWLRFMTVVKQTNNLDKESYHKLFDILKQYQKEVNEICAKKIARNANLLALVGATQQYPDTYYQAPKSHKSYAPTSKQSSSTRSHETTRHKGKEIAKPITPPSESASEEDSDPEQAQRDKDITSSNTRNKNVDTSPRHKNEIQTRRFGNQRTLTVVGARETVGRPSFDANPLEKVHTDDDYNVFANERQHSEQPEFINDTYVLEKVDSNIILDTSDMSDNEGKADQNVEECDDERVVLASLIANLKLDIDENKKIQKQLKKSNASLAQELKECKSILDESNRTRDRYLVALHDKEIELEKYKRYHDCTFENDKLERKLKETLGLLAQHEIDTKKVLKTKGF